MTESNRLWTKGYILLLLANLFLYFGFYLLSPVIQLHTTLIGGSSLEASLTIGCFSVTSLIFRMFGGNISDVLGEKPIAVTGLLVMFVTTFLFMFLPPKGIILFRMLQGIGWGLASAAITTAVSKIIPKNYIGRGMGYFSLTTIISIAFSPIVALVLMEIYGFSAVIMTSVSLVTASGMIILPMAAITLTQRSDDRTLKLAHIIERSAVFPSFLEFLMILPAAGMVSMMALYARVIHYEHIWIYFIGFSLISMITRPFLGKIYDKRGHREIILVGAACMIAAFINLAFARTTLPLVVSSILYGFGYGAIHPSLQAWAVSTPDPSRKGSANGTFLSSMDLGYAVGAPMLGIFSSHYGFFNMYLFSSLFIIVLIVLYIGYLYKNKRVKLLQNGRMIKQPQKNSGL
ncbi:MFS transporter [Dehalobacter sp. DCM]|uniref:MFS transporter n=1 Tax=Dehalobacter sp. DCM TaxID=2907827 RepID=UPI0030813624|nr:MFS transporter [Dehalobacter sp. DCM]